jgi:hypothetical protein
MISRYRWLVGFKKSSNKYFEKNSLLIIQDLQRSITKWDTDNHPHNGLPHLPIHFTPRQSSPRDSVCCMSRSCSPNPKQPFYQQLFIRSQRIHCEKEALGKSLSHVYLCTRQQFIVTLSSFPGNDFHIETNGKQLLLSSLWSVATLGYRSCW